MELNLSLESFPNKTLVGSDFPTLASELQEVILHLEGTKRALQLAAPHPRDYALEKNEWKFHVAQQQNTQHIQLVDALITFYELKRDHCIDQG